ncbi:hypothetical protein MJD09_06745 [bacterium]|nr:hypothetical protein [bacterium]
MDAKTYQEYLPTENLHRHIECFWTHRSGRFSAGLTQRIYPDGCMDIIFNFAEPIWNPRTPKFFTIWRKR